MDNIDESEWLRPIEAEQLAKRVAARGSHRVVYTEAGRFQSIGRAAETVLEVMLDRGWLTGEEASACGEFAACREAFRARLGARTARYEVTHAGESDEPGMADKYRRALRNASKADCQTAADVYETPFTRDIQDLVYQERGLIAEALGRVGRAMRQSGSRGENSGCA